MIERQRGVGIFYNLEDTETALKELDSSHFALEKVFVIAQNKAEESRVLETQLCQSLRDRFDRQINSMLQDQSEQQLQSSLASDSNVADSQVISLTKALINLDIPVDIAKQYNDLVAQGQYLIMIEGNRADIQGAKTILERCGIKEWVVYKIVLEHPEVIIVDRRSDRS